jgi:hypothetical protein
MIKILYIGSQDFVKERGATGSSYSLDLLIYLSSYELANYESQLEFTDTITPEHIISFEPNIVFILDCDRPRHHFTYILDFIKTEYKPVIPVVLLCNDIFHFKMIKDEPNTHKVDAMVSLVKMERLLECYKYHMPHTMFFNLQYPFIDSSKFRDYRMDKVYDITIYGTLSYILPYNILPMNDLDRDDLIKNFHTIPLEGVEFYPFRKRVSSILLSYTDKYRINYIDNKRGSSWNCPIKGRELSKALNQSYLCLSTRSRADRCMQKYFEIPASNCCILGNIPTDYDHVFRGNIVEITDEMSDDEILQVIDTALSDKKELLRKTSMFGEYIRKTYGCNNENTFRDILSITNQVLKR